MNDLKLKHFELESKTTSQEAQIKQKIGELDTVTQEGRMWKEYYETLSAELDAISALKTQQNLQNNLDKKKLDEQRKKLSDLKIIHEQKKANIERLSIQEETLLMESQNLSKEYERFHIQTDNKFRLLHREKKFIESEILKTDDNTLKLKNLIFAADTTKSDLEAKLLTVGNVRNKELR